jgi:hypothetical protein
MSRDEWLAHQFPGGTLSVGEIVSRTGWMHTAGGTGPYLSLKARNRSLTRQQIDDAVYRRFEVIELPTVRDSMMLVPREEVGLALAAGRKSFAARISKFPNVEQLADRIVKTIGDGLRSAVALREELPPKLITNLGEAGKKMGFSSTLPIALRLLQGQGRVLRLAEDFRLDTKRYFYRRWPESVPIDAPPKDLDNALAQRFLSWASPSSADDFAFWSGITKTLAKELLSGAPKPALSAAEGPSAATGARKGIIVLPFRDNYFALHRDLRAFAQGIELLDMSNKPAPIEKLSSLHHNAIVVDGELRGIWEYDPADEKIVWKTFRKTPGVEAAVKETEEFIREELGDHKYYALDHGRTRELRLAFIR